MTVSTDASTDAPLAGLAKGDVVYFQMYFPQNCGPGWTAERRGVVIRPHYQPTKRDYAMNPWRGLENTGV